MELTIDHLPKKLRQKVKYLADLTDQCDTFKLRELRDKSKDILIDIYHHSQGQASYYSDSECRYYTWDEIMAKADQSLKSGQILFTAVIRYKAGYCFYRSSKSPKPSDN